jgi:hypothetical protein
METHEFDTIDLLTFATGGSSEKEAQRIRMHLQACPACRQYVETFESENSSFLSAHPFEESIQLDGEVKPKPAAFPKWRAYALAASLLLAIGSGSFFLQLRPVQHSRIKGKTGLDLYVKNARGDIEKRGQPRYTTGERIQFQYSCAQRNKFMLISIDTTGDITNYYPSHGDSSEILEPGQDIPLPQSITLDSYCGKELFVGVFSEHKLYVPSVSQHLRTNVQQARGMDSIGLSIKDATVWKQLIFVTKELPQ